MSETELFERLERLERAHRRLKGFALAALVSWQPPLLPSMQCNLCQRGSPPMSLML